MLFIHFRLGLWVYFFCQNILHHPAEIRIRKESIQNIFYRIIIQGGKLFFGNIQLFSDKVFKVASPYDVAVSAFLFCLTFYLVKEFRLPVFCNGKLGFRFLQFRINYLSVS